MREETVGLLNAVVANFKNRLQQLPREELPRPSLQKTCLSDLAHMNLLPQDQRFVLGFLDPALADVGSSQRRPVPEVALPGSVEDGNCGCPGVW